MKIIKLKLSYKTSPVKFFYKSTHGSYLTLIY